MTKLAGLFTLALGTAILSVAACGSDEGDGGAPAKTPAEQFCDALATYVDDCGPKNPCDQALLADCADVTGMLNDGYLVAAAACMTEGNAPTKCLTESLDALSASSAHHGLAKKVCDECAFGVDGCEDAFFSEGDGETQLVGKLVLPFGDSLVNEIADECAKGLTCIPELPSCVQGILAERALPTETLQCLISPPASDDTPKCETISGAGAGAGGSGGAGNGPASGSGGPSTSSNASASIGSTSSISSTGSGSGGYNGTCPETTAAYTGCYDCCTEEQAPAYSAAVNEIAWQCGCEAGSACEEACSSVCAGEPDSGGCGTCLNEQIADDAACVSLALDTCIDGGACVDFFMCTSACAASCTYDVECPSGYICEGGACQQP